MQFSKIILSFFVLGIIISMGMTNAFGHGLGYEIMPPEMLGSKLVSLEISSDTWPDEYTKEITFSLFETDTGVNVENVTYFVMLTKQNEVLFDVTGQMDDGVFMLKLHTTESDQIIVFASAAAIIISVLIFLARGSIFRKKNEYDTGEWESKKNRDYEKYHSEWMSDEISFERKGKNKLSDEDFRKSLLNKNIPDCYAILQIQKTASQNEIKNQFRSLAKKWHPDRKQSDDAEKKMAQINLAYEVLSNTKRRKMYDQHFSKK